MIKLLHANELQALGAPRDETTPVFAAPWEASAFAMVLSLYRAGLFEWREWVDLLAQEIATAPPDPTGELYYERWAGALEKLVDKLKLVTPSAVSERSETWRQAYLATPHGQEVRLENALSARRHS